MHYVSKLDVGIFRLLEDLGDGTAYFVRDEEFNSAFGFMENNFLPDEHRKLRLYWNHMVPTTM